MQAREAARQLTAFAVLINAVKCPGGVDAGCSLWCPSCLLSAKAWPRATWCCIAWRALLWVFALRVVHVCCPMFLQTSGSTAVLLSWLHPVLVSAVLEAAMSLWHCSSGTLHAWVFAVPSHPQHGCYNTYDVCFIYTLHPIMHARHVVCIAVLCGKCIGQWGCFTRQDAQLFCLAAGSCVAELGVKR